MQGLNTQTQQNSFNELFYLPLITKENQVVNPFGGLFAIGNVLSGSQITNEPNLSNQESQDNVNDQFVCSYLRTLFVKSFLYFINFHEDFKKSFQKILLLMNLQLFLVPFPQPFTSWFQPKKP